MKWRLPVRYKVPPRNDLIAFALMALAFGLMVGLAIAPGWGNADSAAPVVALPMEAAPAEESASSGETTVAANLQPPEGGVQTDSSGDSGGSSSLPSADSTSDSAFQPVSDPDPTPPQAESEPVDHKESSGRGNPGKKGPKQPDMVATVVGVDGSGYAVADDSGNLLYVHNQIDGAALPKVGRKIGIGIAPLGNGTFLLDGGMESRGKAGATKLVGAVSWIDPESGVVTISARGVSIALQAADAIAAMDKPPALGSWVTAVVLNPAQKAAAADPKAVGETGEEPAEPLTLPPAKAKSLEATATPGTQVDLAGRVSWDPGTRLLTIDADGFGALNRQVTVTVPRKLALKGIQNGRIYAISADLDGNGGLTLNGLSANFSREAASDSAQAFGSHGF